MNRDKWWVVFILPVRSMWADLREAAALTRSLFR